MSHRTCPQCPELNGITATQCKCGFIFSACARCRTEIAPDRGYAVYSEAMQGLTSNGKIFIASSDADGGVEAGDTKYRCLGAILLCESCARSLFTQKTWDTAQSLRIEVDPEQMKEGETAQIKVVNCSIALRAKRRNITPLQASEEAHEFGRLWRKDQTEARRRLADKFPELAPWGASYFIPGAGTLLGVMLLIGASNEFTDGRDLVTAKVFLVLGSAFAVGGVTDLVSERFFRLNQNPAKFYRHLTHPPKWAYIFAGLCGILVVAGGFLGALLGLLALVLALGTLVNPECLQFAERMYA